VPRRSTTTTRTTGEKQLPDKHGLPCSACGDQTALTQYEDTHSFCHKCEAWFPPTAGEIQYATQRVSKLEMSGETQAIPDRRISKETCKKFGVTVTYGPDGSIASHYYPYYNKETKEITATKRRVVQDKGFYWSGDRTNTGLCGQQTCGGRGKYITLVEGEADMLAVSEMFDRKWDVVSLKDGAKSARRDIEENLEFLEGYDNIVLCFDEDTEGRKALDAVKDVFSPNKVKIVSLPTGFKDAGDMLKAGKISAFVKSWWDAKSYSPAGIVKPSETWEAVLKYRDTPSTPYPWEGLNSILLGQRTKEVVIWAAETGVGKSQTMREIIMHNMTTTPERVGCLMLEESVAKSMLGWMSFHAGRPLHKELANVPDEELRRYWEKASDGDRFVLLDHRGWGNDIEKLKSRVRYMAKALGCKTIILDHLHIALSSVAGASGDWAGIDELVTQLTALSVECDVCLHLVSHVSEGRSLRGSKGISKLADAVIFLERDKHHEDPEIANTTMVVVDKNRWAGDVGTACYLRYDKFTGRMTECEKPEELEVVDEF
jgi:twinkle protein